jgi:F0F1-type ATP synthase assembly protein I
MDSAARAPQNRRRRERRARLLGVAVALAAMVAASLTIRWPAPGISVALGMAAYLLARGRR